jgi:F-type H+-transporting ATPase subunit a
MQTVSEMHILKKTLRSLLIFLFAFIAVPSIAGDPDVHAENGNGTKKGFNAGEVITHHISDSHDWHLWGEGCEESVSIPLPVILHTDKGMEFFMSSRFHHGCSLAEGKHYTYKLDEHNHIIPVDADGNKIEGASVTDFSITKNVASIMISMLFLVWIFSSVAKGYARRPGQSPKGLQSFMEPIILFVRDNIAIPNIGPKKYEKFMPYLLTAFFFIWFNNLLGLVPIFPGGANVTGNISVTLVLAGITFILIMVNSNKHYWHHVLAMPGVPKWVLVILTPIEILGVIIRPFVLMMRLFANITAGHIVILAFVSLIFIFSKNGEAPAAGYGVAPFSILFVVFMSVLELLVAALQAYVFTLLSAIYIGAALEEGHHDHADAHDDAEAHDAHHGDLKAHPQTVAEMAKPY